MMMSFFGDEAMCALAKEAPLCVLVKKAIVTLVYQKEKKPLKRIGNIRSSAQNKQKNNREYSKKDDVELNLQRVLTKHGGGVF